MDVALQDSMFYRSSGASVTLGGGEAALHPVFAVGILRECREEGVHTRPGNPPRSGPGGMRDPGSAVVDLFLYYIKHMNDAAHTRLTGMDVLPYYVYGLRKYGGETVSRGVGRRVIPLKNRRMRIGRGAGTHREALKPRS